jgi:DNA-binding CsgD family transcriptional regulator
MEPFTDTTYELTTRQASERYGSESNYSTFHNRMTKLGIRPERRGRQSFLNQEQIELLDRLDIHLKQGGTFSNFVIEEGEAQPVTIKTEEISIVQAKPSAPIAIGNTEIITALQAIATNNYDILTPQKTLKEAAENNYLLTTMQISQILKMSPSTISSWKSGTKKLGFTLYKEHEGQSVVWRVERV